MPFQPPAWPPSWPEIAAAAARAVESGEWGHYDSPTRQSLQARLAQRFDVRHVRLCCSGSAAIEIALRAAGVGPGQEVIVSAYDYPGNLRSVELTGARPVLVDIEADAPHPGTRQLEQAGGDAVRAVIVSHLFGRAADMVAIGQLCADRGWILIEDACQVPGMTIRGNRARDGEDQASPQRWRPAGSWGDFAAVSFGGSKPLTAGCGGALLTNDPSLAARLGPLLDRPSDVMPLSPLQAAVLHPQLDRLEELNRRRRQTVRYLEAEVMSRLSRWRWLSRTDPHVAPAYYKVAWAAEDASHRGRVLEAATEAGLPIGAGFRSMDRVSERRCRKPMSLDQAAQVGATSFVLDHTALLIEPDRHAELGEYLVRLHNES